MQWPQPPKATARQEALQLLHPYVVFMDTFMGCSVQSPFGLQSDTSQREDGERSFACSAVKVLVHALYAMSATVNQYLKICF